MDKSLILGGTDLFENKTTNIKSFLTQDWSKISVENQVFGVAFVFRGIQHLVVAE